MYKDSTGLTLCRTHRKYAQKIVLLNSMEDTFIFLHPFLFLLLGVAEPALIQIQISSSHCFFLAKSHGKHSGHLSLSHSYDGLLGRLEETFLISVDFATFTSAWTSHRGQSTITNIFPHPGMVHAENSNNVLASQYWGNSQWSGNIASELLSYRWPLLVQEHCFQMSYKWLVFEQEHCFLLSYK